MFSTTRLSRVKKPNTTTMKKALFSFAIAAMGLLMASCDNKQAAPAPVAEQAEQTVAEAPAEEQPASLADIVAKAKAEGANWTTDQWKEQFKKAIEAYKPFAIAMVQAKPDELENITKQFADFPTLIKDFAATARQTEGGKAIDDKWIEQTMEEIGVPHL